jgi:flagellar biosynthesis/type III secretory pathway chaperone
MSMATSEELERVLQSELDLTETLYALLTRKQRAIIDLDVDGLTALTKEAEDLVEPLRKLERERTQLVMELAGTVSGDADGRVPEGIDRLAALLPAGVSTRLTDRAVRLRLTVERIVKVNRQNKALLDSSLRFVRETLRFVTDDHRRNLVDHKA